MPEILAIGERTNNAQILEDAAQLGYLPGAVLDLTYGEGNFWKRYRPPFFTTNDLFKEADFHYDFRETPWSDRSFDSVVFDPPYKLAGRRDDGGLTGGGTTMDCRYGTQEYTPAKNVKELLEIGTAEACRLARQYVLVKCMDQVNAGRIHWQTDDVTAIAIAAGLRKKDALMLRRRRAQDENRRQLHARRNYSTLLVFVREG